MMHSLPGSPEAAAVGHSSVGRTRGIPQNDSSLSYSTEYLALWQSWFWLTYPSLVCYYFGHPPLPPVSFRFNKHLLSLTCRALC